MAKNTTYNWHETYSPTSESLVANHSVLLQNGIFNTGWKLTVVFADLTSNMLQRGDYNEFTRQVF